MLRDFDGFVKPVQVLQSAAQSVERVGEGGIGRERLAVFVDGLGIVALGYVIEGNIVVGLGEFAVELRLAGLALTIGMVAGGRVLAGVAGGIVKHLGVRLNSSKVQSQDAGASHAMTTRFFHLRSSIPIVGFFLLLLAAGCGRQPGVPQSNSDSAQKLPFDREPATGGVSPSQSVVPETKPLPAGTAIVVRLKKELSSASAKAGESFDATVDEAITADGQALVARGSQAVGRVLDAESAHADRSGYVRLALVSVEVQGKTVLVDTSSIFAKGGAHDGAAHPRGTGAKDVIFMPDRRLTFHLTKAADLP